MGCLLTLSDPLSQGQVQIKIQVQIQLEIQLHSQIQIRINWVFFYPMSTAFLEAKYKYLLLTEVAGLARLQWIRTIQDFSNLYRFQMLNSRSYESWFVWRMANRSDEQVWISVTLQHLNKRCVVDGKYINKQAQKHWSTSHWLCFGESVQNSQVHRE